jgi:UMF1 family MFS transporter
LTDPKSYRKGWWSWALYDVGNSAFWLVIVAAVFPVYYQELYASTKMPPGSVLTDEARQGLLTQGGSRLAYTAAIAMVIVAVLGPILGAVADRSAAKKRLLAVFAALGIVATGLMVLIGPGGVLLASTLYTLGTIGVAGSMVFYDALLPTVARQDDLDRVSSFGFAAGYLGSVLLFVVNVALLKYPGTFGLSNSDQAARLSFFSVAVWWALFTIPLLRHVREPASEERGRKGNPIVEGFVQILGTCRKLGRYKQLLLFLVAFWIYSDGIGTIIKMATVFGNSLGVKRDDLMLALVITQIVGVPCALGFGWLAKRIGAKPGILLGLSVYVGICVFANFMSQGRHFYVLAIAVGLVQGGTQALSRSLFASMIPKGQSGEFFGFFSTMEKFAGIVGPLLLGLLWGEGGDPRKGILALAVFFVAGMVLLWRVNVAEGQRSAAAG